jgi:drug/metabolite transporter (DMT)-like permease
VPVRSVAVFAIAGIANFVVGRYCNYRSLAAIGTNLAGPVIQFNLIVSLALAIAFLGDTLTPLRMLGIVLIIAGPAIVSRDRSPRVASVEPPVFSPRFAEGYAFAFLASICYGASPVLVRYAAADQGLAAGLAGGVFGSAAATVLIAMSLLIPAHWHEVHAVNSKSARWFVGSGFLVYLSQIFAYMAVAIAPISLVAPIMALSTVFRIHMSRWLNPEHEVFGRDVIWATAFSFIGVLAISVRADTLPLPASWTAFLGLHFP